ncbi:putative RNA 2'-phosphotransferase [Roseibium sp. TrichSKD4]|jgi:putative RNA 2'-phosphotransferase|uniref:RNA 2'-phosphotransferase n=1 Tax=Roseibium sp. TrichSKD4 TaxID=744980 RepID=UPI0001E577F9|nr:RNA 2'-phosphotransferase [Roseibium sp. TrichSKD4]EFO28946.1 putative RNA 2'-phosphotransferase [Roseibium sp. TrichSKD4]
MTTTDKLKEISKFLSYVLRHKPEAIGLSMDEAGWVAIDEILEKANRPISRELIEQIVAENDKQRFAISSDGRQLRANQGHSVSVDLKLKPKEPPAELFHGTASRFLDSIFEKGLVPGTRQHVHLSANVETALKVGQRHGKPVILAVPALEMHQSGHFFFLSENGVWLTHAVPANKLVLHDNN